MDLLSFWASCSGSLRYETLVPLDHSVVFFRSSSVSFVLGCIFMSSWIGSGWSRAYVCLVNSEDSLFPEKSSAGERGYCRLLGVIVVMCGRDIDLFYVVRCGSQRVAAVSTGCEGSHTETSRRRDR